MFVATNKIQVQKGHGRELEDRFNRRGGVEGQVGFLGFEMWRSEKDSDCEEYLIVTHWESKDAHHEWTRSEAFRQAHSGPRADFLLGPGEFNSYDVKLSSSPDGTKAHA